MSDKDRNSRDEDAAGGTEGGMAGGSAGGGPGRGNTLKDASDEAIREMENRRDGQGHAGTGDNG